MSSQPYNLEMESLCFWEIPFTNTCSGGKGSQVEFETSEMFCCCTTQSEIESVSGCRESPQGLFLVCYTGGEAQVPCGFAPFTWHSLCLRGKIIEFPSGPLKQVMSLYLTLLWLRWGLRFGSWGLTGCCWEYWWWAPHGGRRDRCGNEWSSVKYTRKAQPWLCLTKVGKHNEKLETRRMTKQKR